MEVGRRLLRRSKLLTTPSTLKQSAIAFPVFVYTRVKRIFKLGVDLRQRVKGGCLSAVCCQFTFWVGETFYECYTALGNRLIQAPKRVSVYCNSRVDDCGIVFLFVCDVVGIGRNP